ncbi:glycosyltransferase [Chryseobacterium aureum]|uniref:glycosyltransferase n=1 Tax=Chryseobacterium aureum TaxID=2497456 RepID=UPI000F87C574|nr:glycosyltransferase [Chryseobacterium aureum]
MSIIKILLATYNGEKYITSQIDSILNQNGVEVDIVVSDDGSKDKTIDIISDNYPDIRITQNIPGTGSAAKNFLKMIDHLNFAEVFDYVAFCDQDDIWLPEKMQSAVNLLKKENAQLYCSNLTKWEESNNSLSVLKKDFPQKKYDYLFEGGSAGCTYVFTKDFALNLQKFLKKAENVNLKAFSHDWLVYFFARVHHYTVVIDSNSYIHYRIHDSNVHGHLNKLSFNTIKEKSSEVLNGYYQNHIKNYIQYLNKDTEEYQIYNKFLGNYFQRNFTILKYNTQLMRDNKKLLIFVVLNLLKLR